MKLLKILLRKIGSVLPAKVVEDVFPINYVRACHERKIRMFAKLRSDYPYQWYESEVSNHDMKYPYRRARTVLIDLVIFWAAPEASELFVASICTYSLLQ